MLDITAEPADQGLYIAAGKSYVRYTSLKSHVSTRKKSEVRGRLQGGQPPGRPLKEWYPGSIYIEQLRKRRGSRSAGWSALRGPPTDQPS